MVHARNGNGLRRGNVSAVTAFTALTAATRLVSAVAGEAEQIAAVGHRLRGIALIVHQLCVDDYIVTHIDIGAGSILLVTKVQETEAIEFIAGRAVIRNIEGSVAVSAAFSVLAVGGNPADPALDIVRTHLLVVVVSGPGEILDRIEGCSHVERIRLGTAAGRISAAARLVTATGITVMRVHIAGTLAHGLRGIALVVHHGAVDYDDIPYCHILVAGNPLLAAKIVSLEYIEVAGSVFRIHDIEGGVAIGAAIGIGSAHAGNLTLDIDALVTLHIGPQGLGIGRCTGRVVRVFQRTGALCLSFFAAAAAFVTTLLYAVETEQEGFVLGGFRGVALVIDHVTVEDYLVPLLGLGVSAGELLVAQILHAISGELGAGSLSVVRDIEGTVAVLGGEFLRNGGNLTHHIHLGGAGYIGPQFFQVLDYAFHGVRIGLGAVSIYHRAQRTGLVHRNDGLGKADGEHHIAGTVIAGIV